MVSKVHVSSHFCVSGLEILMVCFDKQLASEWHKVAKCVHEIAGSNNGKHGVWNPKFKQKY